MDLAFSTTLIILGLLPGIVFWNSYLSGKFPRQIRGISTVGELALYVFLAVPINAGALWIASGDPRMLKLETALQVITGEAGRNIGPVVASLQGSWRFTVLAYALLIVACYAAGSILRRFVWAFRLDARFRLLQMKHDWYYLLQGRLPRVPRQVLPYADILVEAPGEGSRLYRGLVSAFEPTDAGEIKELVLQDAQRGKGRGTEFKWVDVPGNRFILLGPTIHSINVRYVYVEPPKGRRARAIYELKALARSFFFEEP